MKNFTTMNVMPVSQLGRWALGLAAAGFLLNFLWTLMPFNLGGFPALVLSVIGGALAAWSLWRHDRSWLLVLALIPFIFALLSLPLHFLFPD